MSRPVLIEEDKEWIRSVAYFWESNGDPERFVNWDEARCARLMPGFLMAWQQYKAAGDTLNRLAKSYEGDTW